MFSSSLRLAAGSSLLLAIVAAGCSSKSAGPFVDLESARPETTTIPVPAAGTSLETPGAIPGARMIRSSSRSTHAVTVRILDPVRGALVSQFGPVEVKITGAPDGARPFLFLLDATGLEDSNWWCWELSPQGDGTFAARVKYGEDDPGKTFQLIALVLPEEGAPAQGSVGALPSGALAHSRRVQVTRSIDHVRGE